MNIKDGHFITDSTKLILSLVATSLLCVFSTQSFAADSGLFRWVDENGVVHYGDHVPPKYSKVERQVLNRQAVVIDTLAAEKTKEQLALEAEERKRQAELRKQAAAKAHRDRILLSTYTSAQEIDLALEQAKNRIDKQIDVVDINIKNLRSQRSTILDRLSYYSENEIDTSADTVAELEQQLLKTNDDLTNVISTKNKFNREKDNLSARFLGDKEQFIKLKLQRDESTMAENHPLL